jgi:threonine synthase
MSQKYHLVCKKCGKNIGDFDDWFRQDQKCTCGSNYAEVVYDNLDYHKLDQLTKGDAKSLYQYFDFLPLEHRENIVSFGEGAVPIERWQHLERIAKRKYGVDCQVFVYRNDLNGATGTFKDISASLAASVMKEHGIKEFTLASTGNAAISFSTYLAKAGIKFTIFTPAFADPDTLKAIRKTGQNLVVSNGNYGAAKKEAADYHEKYHVLISAGNIDPLRIEAKRTMVFEYMRQLGGMPDVFMQAVAGGTGPIALEKGFREIAPYYPDLKMPRMILVQQDLCDPMVRAWEKAQATGFPENFQNDFTALTDIKTRISILTAANPGMYPLVAPMVKASGGTFVRVKEAELPRYGRNIRLHRHIDMGPASVVCYAGFFEALRQGQIHNGDRVVLNTGEGATRARWFTALSLHARQDQTVSRQERRKARREARRESRNNK